MKEKISFDNAASTVFAPQLVGLVTTIDRANQPNVATFAWIMSTSHDPALSCKRFTGTLHVRVFDP